MNTTSDTVNMSRLEEQRTTAGFFDLPKELRNYIYWLILKPTSSGVLGSTKVLTLCRQTYEEAIVYLKPCLPYFRLGDGQRSLFRHPKANGKVNLFESTTKTSNCYKYQRYTELELIRAASVQLVLDEPPHGPPYPQKMKKMVDDIQEITRMIHKTTHLKMLAVCIGKWQPGNTSLRAELLSACIQLLSACQHNQVRLIVQDPGDKSGNGGSENDSAMTSPLQSDPFLAFLNSTANALDFAISFVPQGSPPYNDLDGRYSYNSPILYRPHERNSISAQHGLHRREDPTSSSFDADHDFMYSVAGFYHPPSRDKPYRTVPECRTCLIPFASHEELQHHLKDKPSHAMQFRKKRWNPVSHLAGRGGGIVCWTCGYACSTVHALEAHLDEKDHRRHGIVPRYVDDNWCFDRYWKKHEEKYGWL